MLKDGKANPAPGIVFTDLDGTLLDHSTYECGPAHSALAALAAREIPVVFTSSKTRAEIISVQDRLFVSGPFIPENGGAVFLREWDDLNELFPDRMDGLPVKRFGAPYAVLRTTLAELRATLRLQLTGFGDVEVDEVAVWTGLPRDQAVLARQRDFDEPFVWRPEPDAATLASVRSWLAQRGLRVTRGGRFWHLTGDNDKGAASSWLLKAVTRRWGARPVSLALGDSENDISLLSIVDEGILVERPAGGHLSPRPASLGTVSGVGPEGWSRAVLDWLARLQG
ncbi:MAG: HAD-IIB family hydrolase [Acidobacteriota bacterium]